MLITKEIYIDTYLLAREACPYPVEEFPGSEIHSDGRQIGYQFEYQGDIYIGVDLNYMEDHPTDPSYKKDFTNICSFYKKPGDEY